MRGRPRDADGGRPHDGARGAAEGPVLDLSCGSGLFTRRFLQAQRFPKVVALDYSENMLKQTRTFIDEDAELNDDFVIQARGFARRRRGG